MTMDERPFAGETLTYGFAEMELGLALVAASERGVAAVLLGEDRAALRREAARALAGAVLAECEAAMQPTLDAVAAMLATPGAPFPLALDLRGSPTDLAVWEALRQVPSGETTTYGALARTLPVLATAQDVAAACAANRVAVAVPCHRVVKADGSLSGYRWGVQRKRRLINLEGVA
jgi:AraC family transcriptional regulator, regulatory protein of adaptative response / methylated-DNA-[protein]-cysteine methyltransferase